MPPLALGRVEGRRGGVSIFLLPGKLSVRAAGELGTLGVFQFLFSSLLLYFSFAAG